MDYILAIYVISQTVWNKQSSTIGILKKYIKRMMLVKTEYFSN